MRRCCSHAVRSRATPKHAASVGMRPTAHEGVNLDGEPSRGARYEELDSVSRCAGSYGSTHTPKTNKKPDPKLVLPFRGAAKRRG